MRMCSLSFQSFSGWKLFLEQNLIAEEEFKLTMQFLAVRKVRAQHRVYSDLITVHPEIKHWFVQAHSSRYEQAGTTTVPSRV